MEDLPINTREYKIDYSTTLGKGSFGTVYKGTLIKDGKEIPVAMKQISKDIIKNNNLLQLLSNEVVISANLTNEDKKDKDKKGEDKKDEEKKGEDKKDEDKKDEDKKDEDKKEEVNNIVSFLDIIEIDDINYLVYEFCNGGDLKRYLKYFKKLDERTIQNILRQTLEGLKRLHEKKIVHHDIKPENILVELCLPKGDNSNLEETIEKVMETTKSKRYRDEDDEMDNERLLEILNSSIFKLSDFGLSKEMKNFNKKEVGGSPLYVDPMLFDQNVDRETIHNEKVDIWALGVLAYEMFFYDLPFQPFPPKIDKLKALLDKGQYFIDMKKCNKISKQFLSFLNMCLQRPQKIRPLADELLFSEFITLDPDSFTYLTLDDYKDAEFPDDSYLQRDGIITMNIDDNRMINATFE